MSTVNSLYRVKAPDQGLHRRLIGVGSAARPRHRVVYVHAEYCDESGAWKETTDERSVAASKEIDGRCGVE
jgi:hypothetical protein